MTPQEYIEWEDMVYKLWDTMVGAEVEVTCQFSQGIVHGTLRKEKVDWPCDSFGKSIYVIADESNEDQILTPGDIVRQE